MKTLMLAWELPLYISGGLGTACYGQTKVPDKRRYEKLCYAFFQRALIRSAQNRLFWAGTGSASPLSKKYHKKELNLK
jgi:hypothetical protein